MDQKIKSFFIVEFEQGTLFEEEAINELVEPLDPLCFIPTIFDS
jgi:hypothetical protein